MGVCFSGRDRVAFRARTKTRKAWRCSGAISAARLSAAVLEDGHICAAALAALKRLCAELATEVRAPESWVRRASRASDRCVSYQQREPPLVCVSVRRPCRCKRLCSQDGHAHRGPHRTVDCCYQRKRCDSGGRQLDGSVVALRCPRRDRAAGALAAALQDSVVTAQEWSDDHAPPRPAAMTPEVRSRPLDKSTTSA